jgi:hypothetical protein
MAALAVGWRKGERLMPPAQDPHSSRIDRPGRYCPAGYRYPPAVLARDAELHADTLYVVGGLYGNRYALQRVLEMAWSERERPTVVFNGDFNWFNVDAGDFEAINAVALQHIALRGNVETEIAADDANAGCGCAYPDDVSDDEVERSNQIIARLRETARSIPQTRVRLGALPMHFVAQVAAVRVGIVHGDAESLAGWAYSERALARHDGLQRLRSHLKTARLRIIASSHTCLPVATTLEGAQGVCALFNNGAAGMPNFRDTRYGLITRIARQPSPSALYRARIDDVFVEALPVHYDHPSWVRSFLGTWPGKTAAHASYFDRILHGPAYDLSQATHGGVSLVGDTRWTAMSATAK